MKKRLEVIRKAQDKQSKERETELNKEVSIPSSRFTHETNNNNLKAIDSFHAYFKEEPDADAYIAVLDVEGNTKVRILFNSYKDASVNNP